MASKAIGSDVSGPDDADARCLTFPLAGEPNWSWVLSDSRGKVTNASIPPAVAPAMSDASGFSLSLPLEEAAEDMITLSTSGFAVQNADATGHSTKSRASCCKWRPTLDFDLSTIFTTFSFVSASEQCHRHSNSSDPYHASVSRRRPAYLGRRPFPARSRLESGRLVRRSGRPRGVRGDRGGAGFPPSCQFSL